MARITRVESWPHQQRAFTETVAALEAGEQNIVVVSPTGSGKTRMMIDLIEWAVSLGWTIAVFTNRKLLASQLKSVLESHGIELGMIASGHPKALTRQVQLCMTQTVGARWGKQNLPNLNLIIIDERHLQKGDTICKILEHYSSAHAVGYTATPLDLTGCSSMIVAATMSECFATKCLVPAKTYAPDEPDLRDIKRYQVGVDLSEADNVKAIMRPGIFGRVYDHWVKLNEGQPTILFGPDVKGSLYFAEQFYQKGVTAAHIDGESVWCNGRFLKESGARDEILDRVRDGRVRVVCNRFVCLDSQTEILTESGWVGMNEMTMEHQVFNWDEGIIFSFRPLAVMRRRRRLSERMVIVETPDKSLRVTEDHELLFRTTPHEKFTKCAAKELVGKLVLLPSLSYQSLDAPCTPQFEDGWEIESVWCVQTQSGNIITRRKGSVTVMGNCREGLDIPPLAHGILATVFGSLSSYIQSAGRLLRVSPGKEYAILCDHGGNWHRHGSVNADREWVLGMSNRMAVGERHERLREKKEPEPIACPKCHAIRLSGNQCPRCGYTYEGRSRIVVQVNGRLHETQGEIYKARKIRVKENTADRWNRFYHSQKRAGRTFNQAYAWFYHEEHYWPPRDLPLMPKAPADWYSKISEVPMSRLVPKPSSVGVM